MHQLNFPASLVLEAGLEPARPKPGRFKLPASAFTPFQLVPKAGVEPARPKALGPKPSVSASFTTPAGAQGGSRTLNIVALDHARLPVAPPGHSRRPSRGMRAFKSLAPLHSRGLTVAHGRERPVTGHLVGTEGGSRTLTPRGTEV